MHKVRELSYYASLRNRLHEHPDVSGTEHYAHDAIVAELQQHHADKIHTHVGGYGVCAYWQMHSSGVDTIALRADIDALPIGHRCGHDGHTTILLRMAERLGRYRLMDSADNPVRYNVLLIFQPEEETGKGAQKILSSGILQTYDVKAIFGLHNLPGFPLGTVVLERHTFAAASSGVKYHLKGRETHASTPEKGINPGLAAAEIITRFDSLNTAVSDLGGFRQSTLICCRVGEEAFGTSAGQGDVMFTLRAFTNDAMQKLMHTADAIVDEVCQRYGVEMAKELCEPFRATENTPALVDQLHQIFSLPNEYLRGVQTLDTPFRWSEDFADYLQQIPGAFFGIGSGENQPELHHPDYNFPDALIDPAASCFDLIVKNIIVP